MSRNLQRSTVLPLRAVCLPGSGEILGKSFTRYTALPLRASVSLETDQHIQRRGSRSAHHSQECLRHNLTYFQRDAAAAIKALAFSKQRIMAKVFYKLRMAYGQLVDFNI
jgi:hypothetical protein